MQAVPKGSFGRKRQYQAEDPSQVPPEGSQGAHWVPPQQTPETTPVEDDQQVLPGAMHPRRKQESNVDMKNFLN